MNYKNIGLILVSLLTVLIIYYVYNNIWVDFKQTYDKASELKYTVEEKRSKYNSIKSRYASLKRTRAKAQVYHDKWEKEYKKFRNFKAVRAKIRNSIKDMQKGQYRVLNDKFKRPSQKVALEEYHKRIANVEFLYSGNILSTINFLGVFEEQFPTVKITNFTIQRKLNTDKNFNVSALLQAEVPITTIKDI